MKIDARYFFSVAVLSSSMLFADNYSREQHDALKKSIVDELNKGENVCTRQALETLMRCIGGLGYVKEEVTLDNGDVVNLIEVYANCVHSGQTSWPSQDTPGSDYPTSAVEIARHIQKTRGTESLTQEPLATAQKNARASEERAIDYAKRNTWFRGFLGYKAADRTNIEYAQALKDFYDDVALTKLATQPCKEPHAAAPQHTENAI